VREEPGVGRGTFCTDRVGCRHDCFGEVNNDILW
jgi:hypothetical protein